MTRSPPPDDPALEDLAAVRARAQRLALALAAAGVAVWEWDLAARQLILSPEAHTLLGLLTLQRQDGKVPPKTLLRALHAEDRASVAEAMRRSRVDPLALEFRVVRAGGSVTWLACSGLPQKDVSGAPQRWIGTLRDITPYKRIEDELAEQRRRLAGQAGTAAGLAAPAVDARRPLVEPRLQAPNDGLTGTHDSADRSAAGLLSRLPCLTMSLALLHLPGRDQIFEQVLRQFVDSYGAGFPALGQALAEGRGPAAVQLLHSLRGACGVIGASALGEQALALEQALRAWPGPGQVTSAAPNSPALPPALQAQAQRLQAATETLVRQVVAALAPIMVTIDTSVPPGSDPALALQAGAGAASAVLPPDLGAALDELMALLETSDFSASAKFRALAPALAVALNAALGESALHRLNQAMRAYDYETALQVLQGLRPQPPAAGAPAPPIQ